MSLEVFEKLESKVQQAIDTITLLQMEIEELKEKNNTLVQEVQSAQHGREELERENSQKKDKVHYPDQLQCAAGSHGRSLIASRPLPPGRGSSLLVSLYPQVIANLFLFFNH